MFYLKNAIKNVKRNKSKYLIVAILIILISFVSVISLVINMSADVAIDKQAQVYGSEVTIQQDPEYFRSQMQEGSDSSDTTDTASESLTYEDYENYADSEYVSSVEYKQYSMISSEDLESNSGQMQMKGGPGEDTTTDSSASTTSQFNIEGMDDLENSSEFSEDTQILADGEFPTKDNEILVSTTLFEDNNLSIGDKLTFENTSGDEVKLKVTGTYETLNDTGMGMETIYTTFDTMSNIDTERSQVEATYFLNDYKDADKFEAEVEAKGLPESMYVNKNEDELNQVVSPLKNMKSLMTNFLIIILIVGGATLVFVNLLILKERKYEIGVLRALGQSKAKIITSILTEISVVALSAMLIGTLIGVGLSQPVSDSLMNKMATTETSETTSNMQGANGPGGDQPSDSATNNKPDGAMNKMGQNVTNTVTELNTVINLKELVYVIGINVILIFTSSITAISFIVKYQPSKILREGK